MSYTLGSAWQWYATASDLINTRKFYSVEGKPVPIRQLDGQQAGYYPTLADKEQDRNYQKFYNEMGGQTNKYGKKEYRRLRPEYLELQQVISDRFNVISYVPEDRHTQNKNVSQNTKISTRPVGVVKQPTPDVFDPGLAKYEEQLLEEAGGRIEPIDPSTTSGNAYPTQYFSVVPEASADEPYVYSACIDVYRLSNGSVTTTRETVDFETESNYVNVQHLLVRECGKPVPTTEEVKTWYGYFEPEPKPTTDQNWWSDTNVLVGLIAGGALVVPIFSKLLGKKR